MRIQRLRSEKMITFLKNLWRDRRGNALVIAAGALPLLIGSAGFATDTIQWALWKRQLQRAADSAAIAGVYDRVANKGATTNTATAVSQDLTINNHTLAALMTGYPQVAYPANAANQVNQVQVTLRAQKTLPFSSLFLSTAPEITASATAASVPAGGPACVLSLEKSAKNSGIIINGNADVYMPDCIFHTNSPATNSAYAKGSSKVTAEAVSSVGGIQESSNWTVGSYNPYSPAMVDPYEDVTPNPSDMNCTNDDLTEDTSTSTLSTYNCFKSLKVGSNKTLDLGSGKTIYVNGGDAFVQGNLKCTDCTIVLTNKDPTSNTIGNFKVNADSQINMTAPTTGTFAGLAIYQDRRATDSAPGNKINGNSNSQIQGALYFPNQELAYNGTGNTAALCTRFVAKRVIFIGNSSESNKFKSDDTCLAYGLDPDDMSGGVRIRLVA
jgi:Flp pilus assembly protein TadG